MFAWFKKKKKEKDHCVRTQINDWFTEDQNKRSVWDYTALNSLLNTFLPSQYPDAFYLGGMKAV